MGIIIVDTITLDSGIEIANTYGSFNYNTITLQKIRINNGFPPPNILIQPDYSPSEYNVNGTLLIWKDKDAKERNLPFIYRINLMKNITYEDLDNNLYYLLYEEVKKQFINTQDDL